MKEIVEGFLEFRRSAFPERSDLFQKLAQTQAPEALFISCSDSRMVPELVTQQGPGSLFVMRNAGNIVPSYGPEPGGVSATIEYAVAVLAVKDVVICGHSNCGAMRAIVDEKNLDTLPAVRGWLRHADVAKAINADRSYPSHQHKVDALVRDNVVAQLANIKTHPAVAVALSRGSLRLHGWVFEIETGEIEALDGTSEKFVSLAENPTVCAFGRPE